MVENVIRFPEISSGGLGEDLRKTISFEPIDLSTDETDYAYHLNASDYISKVNNGTYDSWQTQYRNMTSPLQGYTNYYKTLKNPIDITSKYNNGAKYVVIHGNCFINVTLNNGTVTDKTYALGSLAPLVFANESSGTINKETLSERNQRVDGSVIDNYVRVINSYEEDIDCANRTSTSRIDARVVDMWFSLERAIAKGTTEFFVCWAAFSGYYTASGKQVSLVNTVLDKPDLYFVYSN